MAATKGIDADVFVSASPSLVFTNEAATDSGDHTNYTMSVHKYLDKQQVLTVQLALDALQTVTITGGPTGGTFTLTYGGNTTSVLAIAATAAQVQTALQALASIGAGNALVTGANGGPWTVQFTATLGKQVIVPLTTANTFTGGSSPAVGIATTQSGQVYTTVANWSTIWVEGIVTFTVANPAVGSYVRASSYAYNVTELIDCSDWSLDLGGTVENTTTFQAAGGWEVSTPTNKKGTAKINSFRVDDTLAKELGNLMVLVLYINKTANTRWSMYARLTQVVPKSAAKSVVTQEASFVVEGSAVYYAS